MSGLYIHIPFCASRCIYCNFYSTTQQMLQQQYVDALCHELELRQAELAKDCIHSDHKIKTIYLGGGTPSLLTEKQLSQLFACISKVWSKHLDLQEVTIECNPDDVTTAYAITLKNLPINRVSMGVQTFDDDRLGFLKRRHNREDILHAVQNLRDAGIENISIDLIFGFPEETLEAWQSDLNEAISLNVEHISAYSLTYEEGTPLFHLLKQRKIKAISEETDLAMYDSLIDTLANAGYEHYEISNFARPGYRSIHNSNYWHEIPYMGVGASAHSYKKSTRSWNISDINAYIDSIQNNELPRESEYLDLNTRYDDLVTTALRTREGINLTDLLKQYGRKYHDYMLHEAQPHLNSGYMQIKNHHLSLTRKGLFTADDIMSDLIYIET